MDNPRNRTWLWATIGVVVVAIVALVYFAPLSNDKEDDAAKFFKVKRGELTISVTEAGTVKNREQVVIKSEVEGRHAILSLVPEGKTVEPGELLVELDSSGLVEQRDTQVIKVSNAEAAWVRAREDLAVAKSQAESDIAKAELDLKFAELDLNKYIEGEYPQALQAAESDITIAHEEVMRASDKLEWSKKLHAQRYLSLMDLQADELALKKAQLNLELAQSRKKVLEEYTHQRDLAALRSDIDQARMALDRVKRKASADVKQAEVDLSAKELEFERQKVQLTKLEEQIAKCRIVSPVAGMVVYATTGRGNWRGNDEPLEEGKEVREREDLIFLPTAAAMMAEVKIHESSLKKVKLGMRAFVTVDAAAGRRFPGEVAKIALLPDAQSAWLNPDLKVYNSEINIDGDASELRAGMSCRAQIIVDVYQDALYVPVQSVVREAGKPTVYVKSGDGVEPRTIEIGLDNNVMVRVLSGLEEGEEVLLAPPLAASTRAPIEGEPAGGRPETGGTGPANRTEEAGAKPATTPAGGTEEKAGAKADGGSDGEVDWSKLSREERRKRFQSMTPEERQKMMEQFRRNGGGRRGGGGQPGGSGQSGGGDRGGAGR